MSSIIGTPWNELDHIDDDGLRREVEYKIADGWDIDEVDSEHDIMKRPDDAEGHSLTKHVVIFLLTAWWTFGIANLFAYWLARRRHQERTIVRLDDPN